jgi:TetR/AcrR family transcriptional repressor of nem operon
MQKFEGAKDGNSPKERLILTAIELFYRQGYDATTVNQIIDASGTHKASFYRYFQSKEDLGAIYLDIQGNQFNEGLKVMMNKSESPKDFIQLWISLLKRQIRSNSFFGCPISKFMNSSEIQESSREKTNEILQIWMNTLTHYFDQKKLEGKLSESFDSHKKAKLFLKLFQGNSQFFIITGNAKYFDEMKQEMLDELTQ